MLNDSFRIYCNKIADLKSHNVDLPYLDGFYQDMLQNITEFPNGFLPIYVNSAKLRNSFLEPYQIKRNSVNMQKSQQTTPN